MKHLRYYAYIALGIIFCGCTAKEAVSNQIQVVSEAGPGFTLSANYGDADSKVTFDSDGLNMTWQPGDVLYMIDVAGNNSTVTLTTDIEKPSKTAKFTTDKSVLSGEYIVVYGQSDLRVSPSYDMKSISDLNSKIRLYGTLSVTDGQTAATISLKQLYAMLTFKFKNLPGGLTNMCLGMAVTEEGISFKNGEITQNGLDLAEYSQNVKFSWNSGADSKVFIAPADFSGCKTYFFIYGENTSGQHVTYEFQKDGKNLVAGRNYNLTFDFSKATKVSTLYKSSVNTKAYVLTKPEDFRAAAYWDGSSNYFSVEADVDFSGEVYFPIRTYMLYGNKHTLSNIAVNLDKCDCIGVISEGIAENITVKNSSFIGKDYVGAIAGRTDGNVSGCCGDCVSVQGTSYIGGLLGRSLSSSSYTITSCSLIGVSTVNGTGSYVGGIIGYNYSRISKCLVKGTIEVKGGDYSGGIAGSSNDIDYCGFEGNVEGKNYVGGISGCGVVSLSYMRGNVIGERYVGGISGYSDCMNSYHIGNTTGSTHTGGIDGSSSSSSSYYSSSYNCYSYGTVSSGYGISPNLSSSYYRKNLTSCNALSTSATSSNYSDYCNCGPGKTFLSKISVINDNEAYSTQVWKDIDAGCPLLQWQAEGFGGDIDIPGFDEEDW